MQKFYSHFFKKEDLPNQKNIYLKKYIFQKNVHNTCVTYKFNIFIELNTTTLQVFRNFFIFYFTMHSKVDVVGEKSSILVIMRICLKFESDGGPMCIMCIVFTSTYAK